MAMQEDSSSKALARWLVFVAALRGLSVFIGVMNPDKFKTTLFDLGPGYVNPLFGRLFAAWTIVTCILCLACAFNPANRAVYSVTLASFVVAMTFFLSECFIFKTVSVKCALSPMVVAGVSITWMSAGFKYYTLGGGGTCKAA